jgi:uncharacterized protein (TIGR00730 family)
MKKITVFCSSSQQLDQHYYEDAALIGEWIGRHDCTLVYGGSARGTMEVVARSTKESGGKVHGIIPQRFASQNMASECADEVTVTIDMHERKRKLLAESDVVVVLPGGAGTMDEFLDAYVGRKLGYINAPIIVCNKGGFFNPLLAQLERCYAERFASPLEVGMYQVADDAAHCCRMLSRLFPTLKDKKNEKE